MNQGLSPPKLHAVQLRATGSLTSFHSPLGPLRWRYVRITRSGFSFPSTSARIEPVSRPARDQRKENHRPGFSKPSRWRYRTSMRWHSSMVVFLLNLYQLPEPSPPIRIFLPSFCRNHKASCTTWERHSSEPVQSLGTLRHLHDPFPPPHNRRIESGRHALTLPHR